MDQKAIKIIQNYKNIYLISMQTNYRVDQLKELFPGKKILAGDFALAELNELILSGKKPDKIGPCFVFHDVLSIDHHSPDETMAREISSISLAVELRRHHEEVFTGDYVVVINHVDADSVLTALVAAGELAPETRWVEAGLAADHTGRNNEIALYLLAWQKQNDLLFSIDNLGLYLTGKPVAKKAKELIELYREKIRQADKLVESGFFQVNGRITYAQLAEGYETIHLRRHFPEAQILLLYYPNPKIDDRWYVKMILGQSAPPWLKLNHLVFAGKNNFGFGCRWNAGANTRSDGTDKSLEEILQIVNGAIDKLEPKADDK